MPIINFQKVNDEFEYCELPYNLYIVKFNRKMFEKFSIARSSDTLVLSGILIQAIFDKKVHISRIFDNNFPLWDFKFNCYYLNDTDENDPCTIDINYPFKWCFIQNNFLPNGKVKNSTFSMKQLTKLYWLGRLDATDYYQDIINHMYSTKSLIALNQLSYKNMNFGNYKLNEINKLTKNHDFNLKLKEKLSLIGDFSKPLAEVFIQSKRGCIIL